MSSTGRLTISSVVPLPHDVEPTTPHEAQVMRHATFYSASRSGLSCKCEDRAQVPSSSCAGSFTRSQRRADDGRPLSVSQGGLSRYA